MPKVIPPNDIDPISCAKAIVDAYPDMDTHIRWTQRAQFVMDKVKARVLADRNQLQEAVLEALGRCPCQGCTARRAKVGT